MMTHFRFLLGGTDASIQVLGRFVNGVPDFATSGL